MYALFLQKPVNFVRGWLFFTFSPFLRQRFSSFILNFGVSERCTDVSYNISKMSEVIKLQNWYEVNQ